MPAPPRLDTGKPYKPTTQGKNERFHQTLAGVTYKVDGRYGIHQVLVIVENDKITVANLEGEILIEHTQPAPGVTYVGNGRPRGGRGPTAPNRRTVTNVLTHHRN